MKAKKIIIRLTVITVILITSIAGTITYLKMSTLKSDRENFSKCSDCFQYVADEVLEFYSEVKQDKDFYLDDNLYTCIFIEDDSLCIYSHDYSIEEPRKKAMSEDFIENYKVIRAYFHECGFSFNTISIKYNTVFFTNEVSDSYEILYSLDGISPAKKDIYNNKHRIKKLENNWYYSIQNGFIL